VIEELIARARAAGQLVLGEVESKHIVSEYRIPVVPTRAAKTSEEARAIARELGFPVVLKILATDLTHKSDIGGVLLGLQDEAAVGRGFDTVAVAAERAGVQFEGVTVQPMAPPGLELLIGASRDPQFGPVVTFGLGGVMVEVYEDVALRLAPLREIDAAEMLDEIRGARVLGAFRGRPPVDRAAIEAALLAVSSLMVERPEVGELDLNPVLAYPDGLLAVDARVILVPVERADPQRQSERVSKMR
jgi:acyl-CoA synthetase (NDP forming)